ncbi:autotransporter outer membrane beta-barrel domain-containing protein [Escherichia coli]|nr:autotransporter outer membrane beta-barrel domain-containing protein [Escherichia coli]
MHQSGSVSLCRSAISVLVATALYSPIALASTVEYGETVDGVVLEKDIQLVYGTANNTKINPGGEQHIKEFGVSNNTEINGGYQYIEMNGAAEYSVLNDGYQIVQMGGAANQTTLNNGVLQVYGAANDTTIKGGRLIVEKDGGAVFVAIEKGGLLEVKEGGFAFAVDQKAGGAIKTTTRAMEVFGTNRLGQFDIKNGIANNMLLENGGSLRVEENDFAYNTTVDSGGLLEVMDGGTVTGVDKKAGGKLIVSTNALEVSGPNSKGQFSIKDGVSKNYELDDGSGLIVMEDTQAIDTILDKHATMQSLGKDTGTKVQANAVYDLGRSYQNGSITYSSKAISENMVINNGRANVWAGTMVNVSVRGNDGILEVMKPQINYAPAMLVGKVVVSEGASFRTHGAVDTSKADVSLENSVWTIIADITTTNQNTLLNLANLAMSDANVIMMDEPVTRSSVTASAENFITLTTNTLSGNGNFYMRTDMANHQSDQLNVTGQATGDFKIFVTDTGASPAAGDSLTLVTTGGGDAAFTLGNAGGVVDIGTYEYTLLDNGNHNGAGAHVESGFRWVDGLWSVRPYLAFTGFTTDGQDYTLSNGMRADVGNTRILRAEAGTAVSYHMDLQNGTTLEPWLKAAVRQEYADSNQVKVNDDGKFNNDVAGTSGVYQAGIRSSFTPTLSGHLSVSYGNGAGVESPWNTQAGVVWTF